MLCVDVVRFIVECVVMMDGVWVMECVMSGKFKVWVVDVCVDGEMFEDVDGLLIVMYKARGVVCLYDVREGMSVYDVLLECWCCWKLLIESVGWLDKDMSGLLLFIDDGAFVYAFTTSKKEIGKWYRVKIDRLIL